MRLNITQQDVQGYLNRYISGLWSKTPLYIGKLFQRNEPLEDGIKV